MTTKTYWDRINENKYDCHALYNCCSCGGNNCGCAYCFDCNACEHCLNDDGEKCDNVQ